MKILSINTRVSIHEILEILNKNGVSKKQWNNIKDEVDSQYLNTEYLQLQENKKEC